MAADAKQFDAPRSQRTWAEIKAELDLKLASGPRWYLMRAIGRTDRQVIERLKELQIESYYPMTTELRPMMRRQMSRSQRRAGMEVMKPHITPLCPRYHFVRLDGPTGAWRGSLELAGLGGIVFKNGAPVAVPDWLIEQVRSREHDGVVPASEPLHLVFGVGDEVMVTDGPFFGFPAIVERGLATPIGEIDPGDRIKVVIDVFGRSVPIELPAEHVNKVVPR